VGLSTSVAKQCRLGTCPGFSWDGVNFHKKMAGLTQTAHQMGYSIPCEVLLSI